MNIFFCHIIWDVSPDVFPFLILPKWYGLMWGVGIFCSYEVMRYIYRKESKSDKEFSSLVIFILLGTLIGARLGHILFYDPIYYLQHPWELLPVSFKDGFEVTGISGLASHGGGMGIFLAMWLYTRKYKLNYFWLADRLVIVASLSGVFIRIGNLFNSEIYGLPTSVPWAFIFSRVDEYPRHPTQLYESIFCLLLLGLLWWLYRKNNFNMPHGVIFGMFLVALFTFRFFIEILKVDQETIDYGLAINAGQLLSIPFVIIGITIIIVRSTYSKQKLQL